MPNSFVLFSLLYFSTFIFFSYGTQLVVVNNCKEQIWPAILGNVGNQPLNNGGLALYSGQQVVVEAPKWWSGRIWARQGCFFNKTGQGSCQTGDCNGQLSCRGKGGQPPATVVEITLGTNISSTHFYDVSLVDGFNLPVSVMPIGGGVGCGVAACKADVNARCPANLAVRRGGKVVGCKSACLLTKADKYCCTGKYKSPQMCKSTAYAKWFKNICPRATSYAYDEPTALKTCKANKYIITFCPPN